MALVAALFASAAHAQMIRLTVSPVPADAIDVPLHATIRLPVALTSVPADQIEVVLKRLGAGNVSLPGQIVVGPDKKTQLWWIIPQLRRGEKSEWIVTLSRKKSLPAGRTTDGFTWRDKPGQYLDLLLDGRKKTRYMYAYDPSSPQRRFETYKVFHHVFDHAGEDVITNGPDGIHSYLSKNITYPHHRGLFIGWNRLACRGKTYDFWHMKGVNLLHRKFLEQTAGPVLARSTALIHWAALRNQPIVIEQRQVTVFRQSDPSIVLLDFHTQLKAQMDEVVLNGDPEHAGMQYRASNAVAAGPKEVKARYQFHKPGIDPKKDKDLPWAAETYGFKGDKYAVQHMNHPANPKDTIYSAYRDYGRFGAFFKKTIPTGETLELNYRIWVRLGSMPDLKVLSDFYQIYARPPQVTIYQP